MHNSLRMQAVQSPIIFSLGELINQYPGTISLGQGVVHYGPPQQVFDRIADFAKDPENNKYKPGRGIPLLVDAVERKLQTENRIIISDRNRVVVTAGANMGFMNVVLAITDPGDEIILTLPYYFNHEMAVTIASCRPVIVPTDEDYQLQPDLIERAITDRTRAVVTISPNNPSGAVYSKEALSDVNRLCRDRGIYHINDEAYEYFTYAGAEHFSPASISDSEEHTISLYSLSKAYGFASWRIGYMVIPVQVFDPVYKIQDTILICPPVISQYAAAGAIEAGSGYCNTGIRAINEVRDIMLAALLNERELCSVQATEGAFYFFLNVNTKLSSMELVKELIRKHRVAVIPGDTFGMDKACYIRVSYGALRKETVMEGLDRLLTGLRSLR